MCVYAFMYIMTVYIVFFTHGFDMILPRFSLVKLTSGGEQLEDWRCIDSLFHLPQWDAGMLGCWEGAKTLWYL